MNNARIRDVELLTGLRFLTILQPSIRLQLITRLDPKFWDRPSWMDEAKCHIKDRDECPEG